MTASSKAKAINCTLSSSDVNLFRTTMITSPALNRRVSISNFTSSPVLRKLTRCHSFDLIYQLCPYSLASRSGLAYRCNDISKHLTSIHNLNLHSCIYPTQSRRNYSRELVEQDNPYNLVALSANSLIFDDMAAASVMFNAQSQWKEHFLQSVSGYW